MAIKLYYLMIILLKTDKNSLHASICVTNTLFKEIENAKKIFPDQKL